MEFSSSTSQMEFAMEFSSSTSQKRACTMLGWREGYDFSPKIDASVLQAAMAYNLRRCVISEGGIKSPLAYLDSPVPQESAVGVLRNLVGVISVDVSVSLGLLPRLVHVLKLGSLGAQKAIASTIYLICNSTEIKRLVVNLDAFLFS
ncbi:unnamed protein product [Fraxinus pennsylvanica]|uniref:Uncharacterized protein n=1 Tax=Fraxinus pennsylvanica TaxID=56036 RepID=A0AAD1ZC56_9LAMI|nr:unnamed protein product [Fraxinus pennsylvanica]